MSDTSANPAAGQAAQFGADVLAELREAVHAAERPASESSPDAASTPEAFSAPPEPPNEPAPGTSAAPESPRVTAEQARRIQDIVDRAKADIAQVVAEYERKRADITGKLQATEAEERKRKAEELVASIKSSSS